MTVRAVPATDGQGRLCRAVAAHYQLEIEPAGREGILPYLMTLTLIAGLMAVWAGLCAI